MRDTVGESECFLSSSTSGSTCPPTTSRALGRHGRVGSARRRPRFLSLYAYRLGNIRRGSTRSRTARLAATSNTSMAWWSRCSAHCLASASWKASRLSAGINRHGISFSSCFSSDRLVFAFFNIQASWMAEV